MSFQSAYNFFKNIKTPSWLKRFLQFANDHILMPSLKELGEGLYTELQRLVIQAAKLEVSNKEKFEYVFNEARKYEPFDGFKDRILNLTIELVYNELKEKGFIR